MNGTAQDLPEKGFSPPLTCGENLEFQPVPFSMWNCQSESCIYCNYLVYS